MDHRFRTADADRDRAAALLRDHFAAGRITAEELDARLGRALNSKTLGDLRRALADLPEPAPAQQPPGRLQPYRGGLERGYRLLLACYPAAYRRVHGEEMLAVLMTAAPEGKRRPGLAEAADLIWGALRVRCQPSSIGTEPGWRDGLAVLSVVLPVFILVTTAVSVIWALLAARGDSPLGVLYAFTAPLALLSLALLRRLRRAATRAGVAVLIGLVYVAGHAYLLEGFYGFNLNGFQAAGPYVLSALGLQMVAVTASPGPRRGLQLLTWKHVAFTVVAAVTVAIISYPVTLVVIPAICAAMVLTSPLGRWLLVLLAIPLAPYVASPLYGGLAGPHMNLDIPLLAGPDALGPAGQAYVLAAVFLSAYVIAACCESLRSRRLAPPSL